ncbi:hypothetical protein [Peptoniphilus harei]|uniref:Uncharacterized protein n=1 Tax=Peptoniphilus harei TaxID=54005 RepID=A0A943Y0G7_9FIRM|nr:hypothetical protein [Peptoniphilus harei]MBS6535368.1 hypothetical protein [Peptoniphilus harei]
MRKDKKKKITLDDVKKIGVEDQIKKAVEKSNLQFEVADWFFKKINFYTWDADLKKPEGEAFVNKIFDKHIGDFYDKFTKGFRKEYKDNIFELFSKETREILFYKINKVYIIKDTVLFEDMKRRILSEINFQMGVADYVSKSVLYEIVDKISKDYADRIDLVNSGSEIYLDYPETLKLYFMGYLFANYKFLDLYDYPTIYCWYKEGWGLMTWIYKINGSGKKSLEERGNFFPNLFDTFIESKRKSDFFKFLKEEKSIQEKYMKKHELLEIAKRKYLEGK